MCPLPVSGPTRPRHRDQLRATPVSRPARCPVALTGGAAGPPGGGELEEEAEKEEEEGAAAGAAAGSRARPGLSRRSISARGRPVVPRGRRPGPARCPGAAPGCQT